MILPEKGIKGIEILRACQEAKEANNGATKGANQQDYSP
jgi:hypothetical protein